MADNRQAGGIFRKAGAYHIKNAGKGGCDEACGGICPVLCGDWDDSGIDTAESVCYSAVYHIMYIGGV